MGQCHDAVASHWSNQCTPRNKHFDLFYCNSLPGKKKSVNEYGPAATQAGAAEDDDDDDIDLFGSDEEDEEAEKIKQERLAAYEAKKSKSMLL